MRSADRNHDSPEANGAALEMLGIAGWFVWRGRRRFSQAADGVRPLTWRGTRNVLVWLAGLAAMTVLADRSMPGPRWMWFLVALGAMVFVAWLWDQRLRTADDRTPPKPGT